MECPRQVLMRLKNGGGGCLKGRRRRRNNQAVVVLCKMTPGGSSRSGSRSRTRTGGGSSSCTQIIGRRGNSRGTVSMTMSGQSIELEQMTSRERLGHGGFYCTVGVGGFDGWSYGAVLSSDQWRFWVKLVSRGGRELGADGPHASLLLLRTATAFPANCLSTTDCMLLRAVFFSLFSFGRREFTQRILRRLIIHSWKFDFNNLAVMFFHHKMPA